MANKFGLFQNTMRLRQAMWGLSFIAITALVGCAQQPKPTASIDQFPISRASTEQDWRDAREISPGDVAFGLGKVSHGDAIALGAFSNSGGNSSIEVWTGRSRASIIKLKGDGKWTDVRIPAGRRAWFGEQDCVLKISGSKGLKLGPCEIVKHETTRRNILIILLDTLRSDHLGCYGYPEKTSPNIDSLAKDGMLFTRFMPQASWTRPSVASLLTSCYPATHGSETACESVRKGLPGLAASLTRQGYATIGLVTNPFCTPAWGIGNDFTRYKFVNGVDPEKHVNDNGAINEAIECLKEYNGRPWFIYLHLMASHRPFSAPAEYAKRFTPNHLVGTRRQRKMQRDLIGYDGEIACVDEQVGRLLNILRKMGQYDDTLIVLLSDHGEQFLEHGGEGHGVSLYEEELRAPLIIKMPENALAGKTRQALVEAVDVAPTILELLGAEPEPRFQGRSAVDVIQFDTADNRTGFASLRLAGMDLRAVKTRRAKCIMDLKAGRSIWFNFENDNLELSPQLTPIPNGAHLDEIASSISVDGAPGTHLLIRPGSRRKGVIHVTINTPAPTEAVFDCPASCGDASANGTTVEAKVDLARLSQVSDEIAKEHPNWTPHAHLLLPAMAQGVATARIECDGAAIDAASVFIGRDARHAALDNSKINLVEIELSPPQDPLPKTDEFAIGVWTVTSTSAVSKKDMAPQTIEALNALGYLQ
jgi:arylsulfatase A-like enzyme